MANKNTGQKPTAAEEPLEIKTEETAEAVAEEPTEPKQEAVNNKAEVKPPKTVESTSGVWCYIGPSLRGLIAKNHIFRGSRAEVLKQAERALEAHPEVQRMIVPGETLARDRVRVKEPGNALYETYQALEKKEKEARKA